MATNRLNYKARKAFTAGASTALAAAPSGNPFLIGAGFTAGAISGAFQEPRTFDPNPFRRGHERWKRTATRRSRRTAEEVSAGRRANIAARGLGGSEFGQSLAVGAERAVRQQTEDRIADRHSNLEDQLAHAEAYIDAANQADARSDWAGLTNAGISTFNYLATRDDPDLIIETRKGQSKENPFVDPTDPDMRPEEVEPGTLPPKGDQPPRDRIPPGRKKPDGSPDVAPRPDTRPETPRLPGDIPPVPPDVPPAFPPSDQPPAATPPADDSDGKSLWTEPESGRGV